MSRNAHSIGELFASAAEVFATESTHAKYPSWEDAILAPAAQPSLPATLADAQPHVLLRGPFKDEPDLVGVAFYVGIGFVLIRRFTDDLYSYETNVINGDGIEARDAFLQAARDLFFHDVKFRPEASA